MSSIVRRALSFDPQLKRRKLIDIIAATWAEKIILQGKENLLDQEDQEEVVKSILGLLEEWLLHHLEQEVSGETGRKGDDASSK